MREGMAYLSQEWKGREGRLEWALVVSQRLAWLALGKRKVAAVLGWLRGLGRIG